MKNFGTLKLLCDTAGVSGFERRVSEVVKNHFSKYCDEVVIDEFNNVVGIMRASKQNKTTAENDKKDRPNRLMFVAHIDEIGMLVKKYEKGGFLRVARISGVDPKTLLATKVIIHSSSGREIRGIIGALPPHLIKKEEKDKAPEFEDLYIDTGLSDEDLKKFVSVGDPISFDSNLEIHHNKRVVSGKSLDNRASVFALIKTMETLKGSIFHNDVIFVASVCEETNSFGATAACFNLEPDLAVAIDVTHGKMGREDDGDEKTFICGKGPVICIAPILSRNITNQLIEICKEKGFTNNVEVDDGDTGTDAIALTIAKRGTPCSVISIPLKYMHTQVEMLDMQDILATSCVLAELAKKSTGTVRDLLCY